MLSVKYVSSCLSPSGYGSAARAFITSLFVAGVNVSCENIQQTAEITEYGLEGEMMKALAKRTIPYKVKVIHLTPDLYPTYMEEGKYNILHLFWETDHLPKEWVNPCNQADEIWTASQKQADMIRSSGVSTLCSIFPQPIAAQKADEEIPPLLLEQSTPFVFYAIFQWIERKDPRTLLHAFWKEFSGNDKVCLLLKTYRQNYSDEEYKQLKLELNGYKNEIALKHYPPVFLVRHLLTDHQIDRLHKTGNCFINPSGGEGWNRPLHEALLFGNPVISGSNGGITDYLTDSHYYRVKTNPANMIEQAQIPWYTKDMMIQKLNEHDLREKMRSVYENYEEAKKKGEAGQQYVTEHFSYNAIGEAMKQRLQKIVQAI